MLFKIVILCFIMNYISSLSINRPKRHFEKSEHFSQIDILAKNTTERYKKEISNNEDRDKVKDVQEKEENTKVTDEVETSVTSKESLEQEIEITTEVEEIIEKAIRVDVIDMCEKFKNGAELDADAMVDVWETAFYNMPEKMACFKILIKKVSPEDREKCEHTFGDFKNRVDWDLCQLEIASGSSSEIRRHFLQVASAHLGVYDNVIITENEVNGTSSLVDESPNQWRLLNNLLLMRDCDTGGVVVFSKSSKRPDVNEIMSALDTFGVEQKYGKMLCDDKEHNIETTLSI